MKKTFTVSIFGCDSYKKWFLISFNGKDEFVVCRVKHQHGFNNLTLYPKPKTKLGFKWLKFLVYIHWI